MKFIFIPRIYVLIFLILSMNSFSHSNRLTSSNPLYGKKGQDWSGICKNGDKQSPINIILNSNTLDSPNQLTINYVVNDDVVNKQFFYDGDRLLMDINLGTIIYTNVADGAQEIYEAYKIELHYPSEHYVTIDSKTPRYEVELQIYHNLVKTNNQVVTNSQIKVNRAVISILFTLGPQEEGDVFFNNLGISKYNTNQYGKMNIPKPRDFLKFSRQVPASYGTGFNYSTFQGLINLINADSGLFFYYGGETTPPCREDILWMVFAQPRSIAGVQTAFIKNLIAKQIQKQDLKGVKINESTRLYGNNRKIVLYDDRKRGKILYNKNGLKKISSNSFFMKEDPVESSRSSDTPANSSVYDS